jgi:hypothetical protein
MMGPTYIANSLSNPILLQAAEMEVIASKKRVSYHKVAPLCHKIFLYPYLHLLTAYHEL